MTDEEFKKYVEIRPYIRGVIALLLLIVNKGQTAKTFPMGAYFVMADDFLTEFEIRRS